MVKWDLIICEMDAGGGAVIDLYYDNINQQVKVEKTLADETTSTTIYDIEDFEPDDYGVEGQQFIEKIDDDFPYRRN